MVVPIGSTPTVTVSCVQALGELVCLDVQHDECETARCTPLRCDEVPGGRSVMVHDEPRVDDARSHWMPGVRVLSTVSLDMQRRRDHARSVPIRRVSQHHPWVGGSPRGEVCLWATTTWSQTLVD